MTFPLSPSPLSGPKPPWSSTGRPVDSLRLIFTADTQQDWEKLPGLVKGFSLYSKEGVMQGQDVLRVNSGNNNTGSSYRDWELTVLLNNLLGLHASGIGNLELDLAFQDYLKGLNQANYPTLVSNLKAPEDPSLRAQMGLSRLQTRALIIQGDHGQYGLLGVSAPDTMRHVVAAEKLQGIHFQDFQHTCQTLQEEVNRLQSHGIHRIILTSHMGPEWDRLLAQRVSGIDVIVGASGGVSPRTSVLRSATGEPVMLLQNGRVGGKTLFGVADILFDAEGHVVEMKNEQYDPKFFEKDTTAERLIYQYLGIPKPLALVLSPYCNCGVGHHEDAVAQFAADAMRGLTGADISLLRSTELREGIEASILTDRKLQTMMPFDEPVVCVRLTGQEILSALRRMAKGVQAGGSKPMLHPSGMAYMVDERRGEILYPSVFNRNISQWEPLDPDREYTVALGAYVVQNPYEFPELAHPDRVQWSTEMPLRSIFQWGLKQAGAPLKPMRFVPDGRIRVLK